jgi:hypothetical protein
LELGYNNGQLSCSMSGRIEPDIIHIDFFQYDIYYYYRIQKFRYEVIGVVR